MKGTLTLLLLFSLATAVMSILCWVKGPGVPRGEETVDCHNYGGDPFESGPIDDTVDYDFAAKRRAIAASNDDDYACATFTMHDGSEIKDCERKSGHLCKDVGADGCTRKGKEKPYTICCCYYDFCNEPPYNALIANGAPGWKASLGLAAALLLLNIMQ